MNEFCNSIVTARKNKNLQSKELAEMIGVNYVSISRIEHGKSKPSLQTLERICNVLNLELLEMLKIGGYPEKVIEDAQIKCCQKREAILKKFGNLLSLSEIESLSPLSDYDLELVISLAKAVPTLTEKEKETIKFIIQ